MHFLICSFTALLSVHIFSLKFVWNKLMFVLYTAGLTGSHMNILPPFSGCKSGPLMNAFLSFSQILQFLFLTILICLILVCQNGANHHKISSTSTGMFFIFGIKKYWGLDYEQDSGIAWYFSLKVQQQWFLATTKIGLTVLLNGGKGKNFLILILKSKVMERGNLAIGMWVGIHQIFFPKNGFELMTSSLWCHTLYFKNWCWFSVTSQAMQNFLILNHEMPFLEKDFNKP